MRRFLTLIVSLAIVAAIIIAVLPAGSSHRTTSTPSPPATSTPNCATLSSLSDSFETVYSTNGGLNPHVCYVKGTIPHDHLRAHTWNNRAPFCIQNAIPPIPGKGKRAVRVTVTAGQGVNGTRPSCTWANRWRYEQQNTNYYYGFMWYFARGWVTPSGRQFELNFHPWICGAPVGIAMFSDAVKVVLRGGLHKCVLNGTGHHHVQSVEYRNGGAHEVGTGNLGGCAQWSFIPNGELHTGVWYEVILHIRWATNSTGQVESWYRQKGQSTWTQTVKQSGFPTLEWGCQPDNATQTCANWTATNQNGITTVITLVSIVIATARLVPLTPTM
jgi:hypothetical protein